MTHVPETRPATRFPEFTDFEDVSDACRLTGIKDRVLLDPAIRSLLERDVDLEAHEQANPHQSIVQFVLVPLRFLAGRFESVCNFSFSVGPGRDCVPNSKIPIKATFQHDEDRGYFWALSLDLQTPDCSD